jgi:hypothetical protein
LSAHFWGGLLSLYFELSLFQVRIVTRPLRLSRAISFMPNFRLV